MRSLIQSLPLRTKEQMIIQTFITELKFPLIQDKIVFILTFLLGKEYYYKLSAV